MLYRNRNGFTLVELIVVIVILTTLLTVFIAIFNPLKQLNKAYDARRVSDLTSIGSALDTYYNDHNCYPQSIPFGSKWASGSGVYMQTVPNDPQVSTNGSYLYLTDSTPCPQWNVTFARLSYVPTSSACSLPPSCLPTNYTSNWACSVSGKVECSVVIAYSLPTTTPTPVYASSQLASTPTPLPAASGSQTITYCHPMSTDTWQLVSGSVTSILADTYPYDIIPPFGYTCSLGACKYPGKNWNTDTNMLWNANCVDVWNADSNGTIHGPDGTWCRNSNSGNGDWIKQISCTDNTGTYYSTCQANTSGGVDVDPGCRAYQVGNIHNFSVGCLGPTTPQGLYGAELICSNLNNVYPGTNSVCSQGMCTGLPSSVSTPPSNISFSSLPGFGPIGGNITANTILDIEPHATDPTDLVGIRMLTVSINGQVLCRRLSPQTGGCIWNVPSSIQGNKIDIQISATSGEGSTASQDFLYNLVQ